MDVHAGLQTILHSDDEFIVSCIVHYRPAENARGGATIFVV